MPKVTGAPEGLNKTLESVYNDCMSRQSTHSEAAKTQCAQIAWGAAKKAGWHKDQSGNWVKGK